jgi:NAD(P)-dependent dehydrogenase (short-subunit alcohol dehydrogenase family)
VSRVTEVNFSIDLSGNVALVTGASSGLGSRFARVLAACGAKVAVTGRRQDRLERLAAEIVDEGGAARAFAFDVRDIARVPAVVQDIERAWGSISILVNNAGITDGKRAVNMPFNLIDAVIDTNLRGPYVLACEIARRLIASGRPGRIVNISSIGAFVCSKPGQSLYSTTKAGIARMTEVLAVEWAPHFINVNAIAPGTFYSEMTDKMIEKRGDFGHTLARKRFCDPTLLDSTLLFLVSPSSEAVTGTVIKVDDGQTSR